MDKIHLIDFGEFDKYIFNVTARAVADNFDEAIKAEKNGTIGEFIKNNSSSYGDNEYIQWLQMHGVNYKSYTEPTVKIIKSLLALDENERELKLQDIRQLCPSNYLPNISFKNAADKYATYLNDGDEFEMEDIDNINRSIDSDIDRLQETLLALSKIKVELTRFTNK